MKAKDLWLEFVVYVKAPQIGLEVPICGLCGNSGYVDTLSTSKCWDNVPTGIRTYCICPNGRANKKAKRTG